MAEQLTFNTTAKLKANSLTMYNSGVTESVAERFSKVDEELKLVRDRVFKIYDHLDEVWNGPASEAYLTQFNRLWNQMNDFSSAFSNFVQLLKDANNKFAETDNNLENIMQENAANQSEQKPSESSGGGTFFGSVLPDAQDAVLDSPGMNEKDYLQSSMGDAMPGNLAYTPLPEKDHLVSTMEAEMNANLAYNPLQGKDYLTSTMGNPQDANLAYSPLSEKAHLSSTMEGAVAADLDNNPLTEKEYLSSTMETPVPADLTYNPLTEKDYLTSTMETPVPADLSYTPLEPKPLISSELPAFTIADIYIILLLEQYGPRVVGSRLAELFDNMNEIMAHELEYTLLTPKEQLTSQLEEADRIVLGDYLDGSPVYREVLENLMALKVSKTMIDALRQNAPMDQTEAMIGQTVLNELVKGERQLPQETYDAFAKAVGHELLSVLAPTDANGNITSLITMNGDAWHNGQAQTAVVNGIVSTLMNNMPNTAVAKAEVVFPSSTASLADQPVSVVLEHIKAGGNTRLDIDSLQVNVSFTGPVSINAASSQQILTDYEQSMNATYCVRQALNTLQVPSNQWAGQLLDDAEQKVTGNSIVMTAPEQQSYSDVISGDQSTASTDRLLQAVNSLCLGTVA